MSATYEEWRVTGEPGGGYPAYDFTWSSRPGPHLGDPEAAARAFVAMIGRHEGQFGPWDDGPHLHHRTVTEGEWEQVDP